MMLLLMTAYRHLKNLISSLFFQYAVSESKGLLVISLFVHQNSDNVTSFVEFPIFRTFLTNQSILVYAFENIIQHALDSETANCVQFVL